MKAFVNAQENAVCGAYDIVGTFFDELIDNPQFLALNEKAYAGTKYEEYLSITQIVYIDVEILEILNFKLRADDFDPIVANGETYTPMYAGKDFEGVLSLGDKLSLSRAGEKYIVAGFLEDEKWLDNNDAITMPPVSLNHLFLTPFSKFEKRLSLHDFNVINHATVGKIFMHCDKNVSEKFNMRAAEKGIKFNVTWIIDFTENWKTSNQTLLNQHLFLAVIVLVCSAISIVYTFEDKGIRHKNCVWRHEGENIFFTLCRNVSSQSCFGNYHLYFQLPYLCGKYNRQFSRYIFENSMFVFTFMFDWISNFLMVLVLFIPIKLLEMYDPAVLIKEEE